MARIGTSSHGSTFRKEFENGGLIRTKSGESRCRDRESLPVAKNSTSKHEKQRRSSAHKQREKHPRNPNSARRERSSSSDKSRKGEATRQSKGKIARIQVEQIENRLRNHTRTHARTRKNTGGSSLTFLSLHSRSPSGARAGASILPVDPRSEQTGRRLRTSDGALWWRRLRFLVLGGWKERRGEGKREARLSKRGRNGCRFFLLACYVSQHHHFLSPSPSNAACNTLLPRDG